MLKSVSENMPSRGVNCGALPLSSLANVVQKSVETFLKCTYLSETGRVLSTERTLKQNKSITSKDSCIRLTTELANIEFWSNLEC